MRNDATAEEPVFANETTGPNLIPFAIISGGWLAPFAIFWLQVWGPLRSFDTVPPKIGPGMMPAVLALSLACIGAWWLPASYYRVRRFERSGRLYEALGVRWFRYLVPDGDLANRWRRRQQPQFRIVSNRRLTVAFVSRTELGEKSHIVWLLIGAVTTVFAWRIGWRGWAVYLGVGNVVVNLYPILLQRYTRSRLMRIVSRRNG